MKRYFVVVIGGVEYGAFARRSEADAFARSHFADARVESRAFA